MPIKQAADRQQSISPSTTTSTSPGSLKLQLSLSSPDTSSRSDDVTAARPSSASASKQEENKKPEEQLKSISEGNANKKKTANGARKRKLLPLTGEAALELIEPGKTDSAEPRKVGILSAARKANKKQSQGKRKRKSTEEQHGSDESEGVLDEDRNSSKKERHQLEGFEAAIPSTVGQRGRKSLGSRARSGNSKPAKKSTAKMEPQAKQQGASSSDNSTLAQEHTSSGISRRRSIRLQESNPNKMAQGCLVGMNGLTSSVPAVSDVTKDSLPSQETAPCIAGLSLATPTHRISSRRSLATEKLEASLRGKEAAGVSQSPSRSSSSVVTTLARSRRSVDEFSLRNHSQHSTLMQKEGSSSQR